MKLMISQPMNGKTTEQIVSERADLIRELEAEGHEVIDTIFTDETPRNNQAIYYLAKSIDAMSNVDGVVFMRGWEKERCCKIEHAIATAYGLFVRELG